MPFDTSDLTLVDERPSFDASDLEPVAPPGAGAAGVPAYSPPGQSGPVLSTPFSPLTVGQQPTLAERVNTTAATPAEQALQARLTTPALNLPQELYTPPLLATFAPDIASATAERGKALVEGFTSPEGAAQLPYIALGGLEGAALKGGAIAARVIGAAFGAQGATQLPAVAHKYIDAVSKGDRTEAAKAWVDLAATSVQTLGLAGAFEMKSALGTPPRIDVAPQTTAALRLLPAPGESTAGGFLMPDAPERAITPTPGAKPLAEQITDAAARYTKPVIPPERQLVGAGVPLPDATVESPGTILTHGTEPGEVIQRISLPVEPAAAKAAREIWSRPIDVEAQVTGADALRSLLTLTDEAKTPGQPYKPPSVNVDLRQLEAMMRRNGVSRVESWADETIRGKLRDVSANPYFDPEFLAAAAVKAAILVKRGVVSFAEWSGRMKEQFGPGIEAHLQPLFEQATRAYGTASEQTKEAPVAGATEPASGAAPATTSTPGATFTPASPANDLFGISQDAREQLASTGRFPYTPPGQGTTAWAEIQRGRRLINEGANPAEVLSSFESTHRLSSADVAVARAHMEQLYSEARQVEQAQGSGSPAYQTKQAEMGNWWTRTKSMGTEWHRIGVGQQGMTDIDTGSLVGMERAYHDATGKGFTPRQTVVAGEKAGKVAATNDEAGKAQQTVLDAIERDVAAKVPPGAKPPPAPTTTAEARAQLGKVKGPVTPAQVQTIWQHAKRVYIEKGEANLDAIAQGTANDLGLPKRTVMEAMAGSKGTRRLTNEMYIKMTRARQAQAAARQWLIDEQTPGWARFASRIPRFFFGAKTFGHGTVGMITHAGPLMFDPRIAVDYWSNFGRQFSLAYKKGYHEAMMQDLVHSPNFIEAKRAGLANDPFSFYDDYQNPNTQARLGWFTAAGNRGFDALKLMRQDLFDHAWNALPGSLKTPEAAKLIADGANHSTGIITSRIPPKLGKALATAAFAPKLEMSRWAFAAGDPAKAAATLANWRNASPVQRMAAMAEVKQKGAMVGTYFALLAANQAILAATGSTQRVNFTDPRHGDFLSFKGFGQEIGVIHPFTRMVGLLADLYRISRSNERGKFEKLSTRREELGTRLWSYAQGKASPFAQPILDFTSQSDFQGRPLPFSEDKPSKSLRRRSLEQYTWPEYLMQTLAPIPVEEALKEVWAAQGMNESQAKTALKALTVFGVTGSSGVRIQEDKNQ